MSAWWALAVVDRAPDALPACTLGEGAIEVVDLEGCALIAARLDRAPDASVECLRAHDAIVRAIADASGALLPARFGWLGTSAEELASPLRAREAPLRDALERVRGAVQITVRAHGGPALELAPEPAGDAGPGTRFLRERARAMAPVIPGWRTVAAELLALVRVERIERGDARTGERWHAYHLVDRGSLEAYRAAAARLRASSPEWALAFGAPSPPYAYADGALA